MTEPTRFRSKRENLSLTVESPRFDGGIYSAGKSVQFRDGRYRTADPEVIRWLRGHELFNVGDRGFFEESAEEPAPKRQKRARPKPEVAAKRPKRAKSKPKAASAG